MTGVASDWSDERIKAAFRERAARRATPIDLVSATIVRVSSAGTAPTRRRVAWAGALAAVVTVAVIAGSSVISPRPPAPAASDVAASSGQSTVGQTASPTGAPTPRTTSIEFQVGARRLTVEVVDESGRLLRAAPAPQDLAPGRPQSQVRATHVNGRKDQVSISWLGSACDPTTRLTIGPSVREMEFTIVDGTVDTGLFCPVGGVSRSLILTFDGPVQAEDIVLTGEPPGSVLLPLEALGLPVITVEEALRHRAESLDDTELAVAGYWYRIPLMTSCGLVTDLSPILPYCNEQRLWLTAFPEPLFSTPDDVIYDPPTGPAIQPMLRNAVSMEDDWAGNGVPALLIGHFDDHRGAICTGDIVSACRGSFVVDLVLDPSDPFIDLDRVEQRFSNTQSQLDLEATVEEAERVATGAPRGATQIVAAFAVAGPNLRNHEPHVMAMPELTDAPAVWVIRYLDTDAGRPIVRTKLVVDGPPETLGHRVYEVTSAGVSASGGS